MSYGGYEYNADANNGGGYGGGGFGSGGYGADANNGGGGGGFGSNDGGFGGGGGGFMSQGDDQSGSQQTPDGGKRGRTEKQSLLPVTVKQLLAANQDQPDDSFKIDGQEIAQVQIIGCIIEAQAASTNLKYIIEDGTGRVEVTMWTNQDDSQFEVDRRAQWKEGAYVKVIGSLRSFNEKRTVTAFDIKTIADHNEVTHHFLESIWVHLKNTKSPAAAGGGGDAMNLGQPNFGSPGLGSGQAITSEGGEAGGLDNVQQKVIAIFQSGGDSESGVSVQAATEQLAPEGITEQQIRAAIEFLSGEGHLYSTVDENHYKSTM